MRIAVGRGVADLAEDDDAGGATVNTQRTAGADVIVDEEHGLIAGILAGEFGSEGLGDGIGANKVNALPRTDIDASFTGDAFGLINMDELLGLHGL
jgi:hypothetical protein